MVLCWPDAGDRVDRPSFWACSLCTPLYWLSIAANSGPDPVLPRASPATPPKCPPWTRFRAPVSCHCGETKDFIG
ncbi:rCG55068 [Rattus norvegicus]|uniref:RCG55068 n=1 Tax=Rattus norvegicus TaxID=10116 RepID=A6IIW0_RAT|nr:rCG55068 [Rattus norvegicus]